MSVRRLADDNVQPASFAFNRAMSAQAKTWIKKYPKGREQSAVIPLLMLAQEQDGWVTRAAIEHVAEMLAMPDIRVLEVATFYTQFQLKPVGGRAHIQVCGTTPCMLMGAEALMDVCRSKIHHDQFTPNAAGTLSWEEVECLGACANAPMIMVFKDTYEDLTPERLEQIIDAFEAGKGETVKAGPQTKRWYSAPSSGFTSLTKESEFTKGRKSARPANDAPPATLGPPTNAAKPQTAALETSPAVKSPSKVKAPAKAEAAASVEAPKAKAAAKPAVAKKWADVEPAKRKATKAIPLAPVEKPLKVTKPAAVAKVAEVTAAKAAAKPAPKAKPAAKVAAKPVAKAAAPKAVPKPKPTLESADRPKGIERPRTVDDLKLISGVGPKIERTLHDLGIFQFEQIAKWTQAERNWADGFLDFHGRIDREDWVKQASALAKGIPEYVRIFGKKPV